MFSQMLMLVMGWSLASAGAPQAPHHSATLVRTTGDVAAVAQTVPPPCEAPPSTRMVLEEVQVPADARAVAADRGEQRLALLRKAMAASPDDVFLHEAYQRLKLGSLEIGRHALIQEYEALLAAHPRSAAYLYLATNAEMGQKTKDAIANLEQALQVAPSFGLPHELLAEIYSSTVPGYSDPAKVASHMDAYAAACTEGVRAPSALRWSKDRELIARVAARLRTNVARRTDVEAVQAYPALWGLEFALERSDHQDTNREHVRQDLDRLFAPAFARSATWLAAIGAASQIQDGIGESWSKRAEEEVIARYPNSTVAASREYVKAISAFTYPSNGTPAEITAFWRNQWQAGFPIAMNYPSQSTFAASAARAVAMDSSATPEEISRVLSQYRLELKRDGDTSMSLPPMSIIVSDALVARSACLEIVPDLVDAGLIDAEQMFSPDAPNDLRAQTPETLRTRRDELTMLGKTDLVEALARLGRPGDAKSGLLEIEDWLHRTHPSESASSEAKFRYAGREAQYWFLRGLTSEAEGRKLDALIAYRNAVTTFPPRRPSPDRRDEVMAAAERVWKELRGTAQGWNDWASSSSLASFNAGSGTKGSAWGKLAASNPDLVLTDSLGTHLRPLDLAKKTVFLTVWASWCGPCRAELPFVERVYQQLKGRDDVAVLALNVDDDPKLMDVALGELKVRLPSIAARDFAYSLVPAMALPSNWILTPSTTEMFNTEFTQDAWVESVIKAITQAAGK